MSCQWLLMIAILLILLVAILMIAILLILLIAILLILLIAILLILLVADFPDFADQLIMASLSPFFEILIIGVSDGVRNGCLCYI